MKKNLPPRRRSKKAMTLLGLAIGGLIEERYGLVAEEP